MQQKISQKTAVKLPDSLCRSWFRGGIRIHWGSV